MCFVFLNVTEFKDIWFPTNNAYKISYPNISINKLLYIKGCFPYLVRRYEKIKLNKQFWRNSDFVIFKIHLSDFAKNRVNSLYINYK